MAHIADFIVDAASSVGLNNLIARELSVSPSPQDIRSQSPATEEKEKYIWRMHQPSEAPRKYSIFPSKEKLSISSGRRSPNIDSESTFTSGDKQNIQKPKELNKRRKPSLTELGFMTTVHESAMDSPTIPGRPPIHERSFDAPGGKWRQNKYGESLVTCIEGPTIDEGSEADNKNNVSNNLKRQRSNSKNRPHSPHPLSPKSLAPLLIPSKNTPKPQRVRTHSSPSTLRSPTPPQVPPKSARMMEHSPHHKSSPFTPSSTTLSTAPTSVITTATTPNSPREGRSSPKPWMSFLSGRSSPRPTKDISTIMHQGVNESITSLPLPTPHRQFHAHSRNQSETFATQQQQRSGSLTHTPSQRHQSPGHYRNQSEAGITQKQRSGSLAPTPSHRRGEPEFGPPAMDRGRSKKRADGSHINGTSSRRTQVPTLEEQLAFDRLPQGVRVAQASSKLTQGEMETLRYQAIGQVNRFEVLNSKDVDELSRELRALDERCLYLRKTHRSLRAGRRNLHDRICTYLRSPRTARFSHDSILKQEEALAELDSSIDDWVSKLDQAENRRTRVRQKLLEHVAAAVFMPVTTPKERNDSAISMAVITPPRSPIKETIPIQEALLEVEIIPKLSEMELKQKRESRRRAVESIRIYADSDVFALLADVEDEINRMGDDPSEDSHPEEKKPKQPQPQLLQAQKKESTEASRPDNHLSPSAPSAATVPMSPFLLKPAVFVMPSHKQGVKV
ncbi:hypothetical protein EYC80_006781 [Monilinia laxa]|uniref:Up-regulated during septation protein 1 domain-containing protein n=1 Tax=Monilinia laxa TaxID=61186 RepID=A0A5N6JZ75_MONLA|nr:hypothetical protein EYC80_006781 [Monilinia laxa]